MLERRIDRRRSRVDVLEGHDADVGVELGDSPDRRRAAGRIGQRARVFSRRRISRHRSDTIHRISVRNDLGPAVVQVVIAPHPGHVLLHHVAGFRRRIDGCAGPLGDISGIVRRMRFMSSPGLVWASGAMLTSRLTCRWIHFPLPGAADHWPCVQPRLSGRADPRRAG